MILIRVGAGSAWPEPGLTVDQFPGDVQVTGTPRGLLDHVQHDPANESFFASLKGELIDTRAWPTRPAARRAVVEYIAWYNGTRLYSTLGYRSPVDFENGHHEKIRNVA